MQAEEAEEEKSLRSSIKSTRLPQPKAKNTSAIKTEPAIPMLSTASPMKSYKVLNNSKLSVNKSLRLS
jgi:hypothetical protein